MDDLRATLERHIPYNAVMQEGPVCNWCEMAWPCDAARALAAFDAAESERDLAVAHDRQPYPTAAAYEAVCVALHSKDAELKYQALTAQNWQDLAERAESQVAALVEALTYALPDLVYCHDLNAEVGIYRLTIAQAALSDISAAATQRDAELRRAVVEGERERLLLAIAQGADLDDVEALLAPETPICVCGHSMESHNYHLPGCRELGCACLGAET